MKGRDRRRIKGVAADQPMWTKLPEVTRATPDRTVTGYDVLFRRAGLLRRETLDQAVDLGYGKAGQADVEVEVERQEVLQLFGQDLLVPAGIQSELVVGQNVSPLLGRAHPLETKAGHLVHPEELCRGDTAMPCENGVVVVDQHRVGEAEAADRVSDLPNLLFTVCARVARPRAKCRERQPLKL